MKTFTNTGSSESFDIVHMIGDKDKYTLTESAGKLTYESVSLDRTYIVDGVEEFGFKYSNGISNKFKWTDEFSPFLAPIGVPFNTVQTQQFIETNFPTYRTMFYIEDLNALYYMEDKQDTSAAISKITFDDLNNLSGGVEVSIGTEFDEASTPNTNARGTIYYNDKLYNTGWSGAFMRVFEVTNNGDTFTESSSLEFSGSTPSGSWGLAIDYKNNKLLFSGNSSSELPRWVDFNVETGVYGSTMSDADEFTTGGGTQGALGIDPLTGYYYMSKSYNSNQIYVYNENKVYVESFNITGLDGIGAITVTEKHLFISADNTNTNKIYYLER